MAEPPDQPPGDWLTLRQAAARTGMTKDAVRHRVRRRSLPASKGNDGVVRVSARDLSDLPPPDPAAADQEHADAPATAAAMADLAAALAGLGTTLAAAVAEHGRTLADLEAARAGQVASQGRAEAAEARARAAETRADAAELALEAARTPWTVKVIRALRGRERS